MVKRTNPKRGTGPGGGLAEPGKKSAWQKKTEIEETIKKKREKPKKCGECQGNRIVGSATA